MKIIQLLTGQDGEGHVLYGLGDDGCVYESWTRTEPRITFRKATRAELDADSSRETKGVKVYKDGNTGGWRLLVTSDSRAKVMPHPDDPTRCERS